VRRTIDDPSDIVFVMKATAAISLVGPDLSLRAPSIRRRGWVLRVAPRSPPPPASSRRVELRSRPFCSPGYPAVPEKASTSSAPVLPPVEVSTWKRSTRAVKDTAATSGPAALPAWNGP
jgi:hypothetical protein